MLPFFCKPTAELNPFPATRHSPLVDGDEEEVNEPGQGVLVHGVDVGEVRDGEEQDGAVGGHGAIPRPRLLDLSLCLISHLGGKKERSEVIPGRRKLGNKSWERSEI